MAKLKSVIKIEGTLNELTFYKTQDGNLVRTKGGISGNRIANDPQFARTRENNSEFSSAAKAGKLVRSALRNLMAKASDGRVTSRLTQLMRQLLVFDATSNRGDRNVTTAIVDAAAKALLNNFNFNIKAVLGTVLAKPFAVDVATGVIIINGVVPLNDVAFPVGATHVSFSGAWAKLDFTNGTSEVVLSNVVDLPIDNTSTVVTLIPAGAAPTLVGTSIFALEISFSQMVNGQEYPLSNGAFNCLSIVGVV